MRKIKTCKQNTKPHASIVEQFLTLFFMYPRGGTTESVWMNTTDQKTEGSVLMDDMETDVCVIGAGISGLTTAYLLAKEGKNVIVLDDGEIGGGETERTTAHIAYALDDRYFDLIKWHGEKDAKAASEAHVHAIGLIEKIVKDEKIDCDFKRVDGYLYTPVGESDDILEKELKATHDIGLTGVQKMDKAPLSSFDTGACLLLPDQAQFHPMKYLQALAACVLKNGGRIFTGTHATLVEEKERMEVKTEKGQTITADAVVVATNGPMDDNAQIYTKQAPYRSFVIGLQIPKGYFPELLLWDTLEPYHYVRMQPLDDAHDVLIVGGEDHRTGEENDMDARHAKLEEWARVRFPEAGKRLYAWSGQVLETADGLALIGVKPGSSRKNYVITGDSGMGMTHGTIGGILVTDLIMERDNPWEDVFSPSRIRSMLNKEFLTEGLDTGKHAVGDYLTKGDVEKPEDVRKGEGALMRKGVTKIALYRDEDGGLHTMSAVCPHKGCIVQWNSGEKSWDCPCHGSRFSCTGKVLNGPTSKDLAPIQD